MGQLKGYWSIPAAQLLEDLGSNNEGLTQRKASIRLSKSERRSHDRPWWVSDLLLFIHQFNNPLILLLVFAVGLSTLLGEYNDAFIVVVVLAITGLLGFIQERNANRAVEQLRNLVKVKVKVYRDGELRLLPSDRIVSGDIISLSAGDILPGDAIVVDATDLHVNEAALTGESYPADKFPCVVSEEATLMERRNTLFQGSSVVSGVGRAIVVATGDDTVLGGISRSISTTAPETAFEQGIRKFGYLLMQITLILSILILLVNLLIGKPVVISILFALALAVGLAPELLPAIVTITLSAGAARMARKKVIVKKLAAIQNLGEIDIFCCDKTGTLTEGTVQIHSTIDWEGRSSERVAQLAYLNAYFESGYANPIDTAIRSSFAFDIAAYSKFDEVPYDFIRKRLSIVVARGDQHIMVTKGAVGNILQVCSRAELPDGQTLPLDNCRNDILHRFEALSSEGFRVIGLAWKDISGDPVIDKNDEQDLIFLGFIVLHDPPKQDILEAVGRLKNLGVSLKLITGDNRLVAAHLAQSIGLRTHEVLDGKSLHKMTNEALARRIDHTDVFAEIEPSQKERIVKLLQKKGHVVGFVGDGINDASAIRTADVGISIDNAVDVAKEAADIVLLENNLDILSEGVIEGRKTFVNTLKYIYITTSANFGNMFSVAGASILLPFLPLLPIQILLVNFFSDIPSLAIASDKVDPESLQHPKKWDMEQIKRFMTIFGLQSSIFDFMTFGVLLYLFQSGAELFRTGWFIESILSEIFILLVIRTSRPLWKSRPGKYLLIGSVLIAILTIATPYIPWSNTFGFVPLHWHALGAMILLAVIYTISGELSKHFFYKHIKLL